MNETTEMIREQMHETRASLFGKLESLEHHVSQTVQSTGAAVNATVGAVQETVETVTEAVQDAVRSASNAVDVPRQIDRHPWLALGGSVALGFLAAELLHRSKKRSKTATLPCPLSENAGRENTEPAVQSAAAAPPWRLPTSRESRVHPGGSCAAWRSARSWASRRMLFRAYSAGNELFGRQAEQCPKRPRDRRASE